MIALESIRRAALWGLLAVSAFAAIEPSPYEFMFAALLIAFAGGGLTFDKSMAPMLLTMALFNAAGLIALIPYVEESASVSYTLITIYISVTMIVFAALVVERPIERLATIRSGYVFAALVAAGLGIVGYFNVAGLGSLFTAYDNARASGPFKDPNVFAPFLIAPIVWLAQDVLIGRGRPLIAFAKLTPLLIGLALSFSRGAAVDLALALILLFGLSFIHAETQRERRRALAVALAAIAIIAALILVLLMIPAARETLLSRASLTQDYDLGVEGRFGNQARALPALLERPFGFGPLRFAQFFPEDPHQAFLSAFASYGWLGGLAFTAFVAATIYVGSALALRRSWLQAEAIALWSATAPQILQGVQIDTQHWRHLYLLIGCVWGLVAAERMTRPAPRVEAEMALRNA